MYSIKYKMKKIEELKQNERFLPYVENLQKQWKCEDLTLEDFMMQRFDGIVDNFELTEFFNTADQKTIDSVCSSALKELKKEFKFL